MNVAKHAIAHLVLFGIWRPISWNSKFSRQIYKVYSCFILTALVSFSFYLLIYIFKFSKDVNSLTQGLIVFYGILGAIIKMIHFITRQEEIITLDRMFSSKICLPRDQKEVEILKKSEDHSRKITTALMTGCYLCSTYLCLIPLMNCDKMALPYPNVWIPLNFESSMYYRFVYLYHVIVILFSTVILCDCDIYLSLVMEKICAELEVFQHRLCILPWQINKNFEYEQNQYELSMIKDWLHLHLHLLKIVNNLNKTFNSIVIVQYFISTSMLGLTIFHLAKEELFTSHFWYMCIYLTDYIIEIFLFCYYGEKMIVKSTEIVNSCYNVNWNTCCKNSRMSLCIIMMRANKPMKLVGGSMITMSTSTFVMILKVAYSIFNVLREVN